MKNTIFIEKTKQSRLFLKSIVSIQILISIFILIGCNGCGVGKKISTTDGNISDTSYNAEITDNKQAHEIPIQSERDSRKPHPDSIVKWNAQVLAEINKYKVKPDKNTKMFTIDPNTGQVQGCPHIKLKGILDEKYYADEKKKRDALRQKFELIKPVLRPVIMQGSNELWYGEPKNVEIEGSPEAVHSGRGPTGYIFNESGTRLIVPVGYPHGGKMQEIYFFDNNNNLIAKHKLDKALDMPYVNLNAEETFVIVSSGVSGDFYFFTIDGKLERKGNFNKLTGDRGNSYGYNNISETGKYWVFSNNLSWLYNRDGELISKFPYAIYKLNEKANILICIDYINIFQNRVVFKIFSIEPWNLIYQSNEFISKTYKYEF